MSLQIKYDPDRALEVCRLRKELELAKREFSDQVMDLSGIKIGQKVRNKWTGAIYRIVGATTYTTFGSTPRMDITLRRTYKSGRPDARATSVLSNSELEICDADS